MPPSIDNLLLTTEQDFPVASDFPGSVRFVVAQEALNHLEQNLATFEKIFADFHIQKSDYRLLAGFDEDIIRAHLGFLNQIHILIRSEPEDITSFLSRLSPALEGFSAFVFTDKFTYRIPSSPPEFHNISRHATHKTTRELPSCISTLSQNVGNVNFTVGGPSVQSSNGKDGSRRKGKEGEVPERNSPPDPDRTADGDTDPEFPGPDGNDTRSAVISFRVISHLHRYDQPRAQHALRGEPFQKIQVQGKVKVKRISESQDPRRFAICDTEFTELSTTFEPNPTYHHFQLDVRIDAKEKFAHITKKQPVSTSKYNPESKVSHGSKKAWNMLVSATLSFAKPQGTIGTSGSRSGEQSTATEKTTFVSRIIERDIGPVISWSFHIADPFDQDTGLTLSSEKLPVVHFEFRAKTPVPPPEDLPLEISTYWSILSPRASSAWLSAEDTPSFSNLCKVITLKLPSYLRGSHTYNADLLVWPKHSNLGATVTQPDCELEGGVRGLVTTKVVDTDHEIDSST